MNEADLIFQDVVEGNILQMADKVVALLRSKYIMKGCNVLSLWRYQKMLYAK